MKMLAAEYQNKTTDQTFLSWFLYTRLKLKVCKDSRLNSLASHCPASVLHAMTQN